jgi:branched-chain amino acid transport system ATP-binding protein
MTIEEGERRLILGPNGAGKTTLFNLLGGDPKADAGSVRLLGQEIGRLPAARRAAMGIARTYQVLTLFDNETLVHNVTLSLLGRSPAKWYPLTSARLDATLREKSLYWLSRVGLESLGDKSVSSCTYGEKRRLELALALAQEPRLLLLDEPYAGLSAAERLQVSALVDALPRDLSIIMIEHDMDVALQFAERISIMHHGRLVVEGSREDVVANPRTREVYLGH